MVSTCCNNLQKFYSLANAVKSCTVTTYTPACGHRCIGLTSRLNREKPAGISSKAKTAVPCQHVVGLEARACKRSERSAKERITEEYNVPAAVAMQTGPCADAVAKSAGLLSVLLPVSACSCTLTTLRKLRLCSSRSGSSTWSAS